MKSTFKYFAISERDKNWGMYVLNCGITHFNGDAQFPPGGHPQHHTFRWEYGRVLQEYQIIYLIKGNGLFESQSIQQRQIHAGEMVLLFPNEWHRYKPLGPGWHTYWAGFDGTSAQHLEKQQFFSRNNPIMSIGYQEHIVRAFTDLVKAGHEERGGHQQIMAGLLTKILGYTSALQHRQKFQRSNQEEIVRHAQILLVESIEKQIPIEDVAKALGLGYSYFRQLFKAYTGLAPGQYLIQLRLEKSKELLANSELPIKHIADQSGFESVHYFSRLFKQKSGVTPGGYRKMAKGE